MKTKYNSFEVVVMEEMRISFVVSQKNNVMTNWNIAHEENLPSLLDAVKCLKQHINDYLSELIHKQKCLCSDAEGVIEQTGNFQEEDVFEDLLGGGDSISGFIKDIEIINKKNLIDKNKDVKGLIEDSKKVKKIKL